MSQLSMLDTKQEKLKQLRQQLYDRGAISHEWTDTDESKNSSAWYETGFPAGSLIELLAEGSASGATTLAFLLARRGALSQRWWIISDRQREWQPAAVTDFIPDLKRCLVLRPESIVDEYWAIEQALRSSAVGVTLAWLEHIDDRVYRRFRLAAETGKGITFFIRSARYIKSISAATTRLHVQSCWVNGQRKIKTRVLRHPTETADYTIEWDWNDDAYDVHLATPMALTASLSRRCRA